MRNELNVWVIGGDMRQVSLAEDGPLIEQVLDALRPGQVVCGGRVSPQLQAMALERDLRLWDYYAREELAVSNAVPTALAVGHWEKRAGAHI